MNMGGISLTIHVFCRFEIAYFRASYSFSVSFFFLLMKAAIAFRSSNGEGVD